MENKEKKVKILLLSTSNIKKEAIKNVFFEEIYEISYIEVPDNPNRQSQPLFINGINIACEQRINEYLSRDNKKENANFIISIENGIFVKNYDENYIYEINNYNDYEWSDICAICILDVNENKKKYFISPVIINIDKKYTIPYFESVYNKDKNIDTLGKYIAKMNNNNIPHNNWMKYITGIDRITQIKMGLERVKENIFL
jgi:hypothetical protein